MTKYQLRIIVNKYLQCSSLYLKVMEVAGRFALSHYASFIDLRFSILMDLKILNM